MECMLPFPTVLAAFLLALTLCLSAFFGLIAGEVLRIFSRAVHPRSVLNAILGAVGFRRRSHEGRIAETAAPPRGGSGLRRLNTLANAIC